MSTQHDLIVIGAGPGGYVAAIRAAQLGLNTACIEEVQQLGGTCLRIGCIPSKALLESSDLYHQAHSGALGVHGIACGDVQLDLAAMLRRKQEIVDGLTGGVDGLFTKNKVKRYFGHARFTAPGRLVVEGQGEAQELSAPHIIIATGSKPAQLRGVEQDGVLIGDSTTGLCFEEVPGELIIIGGGYIGFELGSVWLRLGSKVTVLEYLERILPGADAELAREAQRIYKKQGFDIRTGMRVTGAAVSGEGKARRVEVQVEGGEPLQADRVLCVTGRWPHTDGLDLDTAGVALDERGRVVVGEHYRTAVPGIYAIGDVIAGPMLAHKASEEGVACVERIATGYGHVNYDAIPSVVYTEPELASVGKTEDELVAAGLKAGTDYKKGVFMFRANGRARALNHTDGRVKVLADAATDRVLGVHILGPRAGELIAEAVVAMECGASAEDIARICHAHPTLSEVIKEAALAVDGRALHA
jgi:dihydrolipoamide dehydrogenase